MPDSGFRKITVQINETYGDLRDTVVKRIISRWAAEGYLFSEFLFYASDSQNSQSDHPTAHFKVSKADASAMAAIAKLVQGTTGSPPVLTLPYTVQDLDPTAGVVFTPYGDLDFADNPLAEFVAWCFVSDGGERVVQGVPQLGVANSFWDGDVNPTSSVYADGQPNISPALYPYCLLLLRMRTMRTAGSGLPIIDNGQEFGIAADSIKIKRAGGVDLALNHGKFGVKNSSGHASYIDTMFGFLDFALFFDELGEVFLNKKYGPTIDGEMFTKVSDGAPLPVGPWSTAAYSYENSQPLGAFSADQVFEILAP